MNTDQKRGRISTQQTQLFSAEFACGYSVEWFASYAANCELSNEIPRNISSEESAVLAAELSLGRADGASTPT